MSHTKPDLVVNRHKEVIAVELDKVSMCTRVNEEHDEDALKMTRNMYIEDDASMD